MADLSLIQDDSLDDSDEGVFEQGDGPSGGQADDDTLPPLMRVQKHALSENVFERQMVPRVILDLFRAGPADLLSADLPQIMNIVSKLADEDETMVRMELIEQVPNMTATAIECAGRVPELNTILNNYLLPLIVRNLGASDNQVRKTAQSTLFEMMEKGLVTRQQTEAQVCPTVLALSNMESLMDYHTSTVTLMSRLAPFLGREVTERMFLQCFSQLCSNHMFYVRKVCASHFGNFCAVIGKEAYERVLLPCYLALCTDDVWGVRKACAEVVMSVSCACPPLQRRTALAPVFARLLQDQSRWVRMSAFQTLGPFISTFADPTITNLAYNNIGELVLVNNDGTEFRIAPTSTDNVLRSVGELQMLYQFQERSKDFDDEQQPFNEKEGDDNVIFSLFYGDDGDNKEMKVDNVSWEFVVDNVTDTPEDNNTETTESVNNSEDGKESQIHSAPTAQSSFLDQFLPAKVINEIRNFVDETLLKESFVIDEDVIKPMQCNSCDNVDDKSPCQDISELSEKVSYLDIVNNDHSYISNASHSNKSDKNSDSSDNCIEEIPLNDVNEEKPVYNNQNGNCTDTQQEKCENVEEFNSFNYWYVSPEMPLDPNIITPEDLHQGNSNVMQYGDFSYMNSLSCSAPRSELLTNTWASMPYPKMDKFPFYIEQHLNGNRENQFNSYNQEPIEMKPNINNECRGPPQYIVPQLLIDHFVSMTDPNLAQNTDNEMAYHCAYSLPAVALTLGSKNWYLLKDAVENLAANMQYKVRRTLASSLHELAMILGPDIASNNLTPIFEGFIKDLDEVRIGVLKHLAHFLKLIDPNKRNLYLPRLAEFLQMDNEANWRFRQELAEQLLMAVPLFKPSDATKHISTIAQELLCDKVAAVREVALLLITELIRHVSSDSTLTSRLLMKLAEKFAHSKRWKLRQSFALLCSELLTSKALPAEQFASEVMPHLLDLSWDPVPNVRLVVARTISRHIVTNEYFADVNNQHYDGLQTVLRRLQSDKDRDVRQSAVFQRLTSIQ